MAAVHLTNSYCVPSLLYACEIWSLRKSSAHSVRVALKNSFRRILLLLAREPKVFAVLLWNLASFVHCWPASYTLLKKLKHQSSILIITIARLCQHDILSVAAKYGIYRLDNSVSFIKKSAWKIFAASAVYVVF